jgi:hypothetical protein
LFGTHEYNNFASPRITVDSRFYANKFWPANKKGAKITLNFMKLYFGFSNSINLRDDCIFLTSTHHFCINLCIFVFALLAFSLAHLNFFNSVPCRKLTGTTTLLTIFAQRWRPALDRVKHLPFPGFFHFRLKVSLHCDFMNSGRCFGSASKTKFNFAGVLGFLMFIKRRF